MSKYSANDKRHLKKAHQSLLKAFKEMSFIKSQSYETHAIIQEIIRTGALLEQIRLNRASSPEVPYMSDYDDPQQKYESLSSSTSLSTSLEQSVVSLPEAQVSKHQELVPLEALQSNAAVESYSESSLPQEDLSDSTLSKLVGG